MIHLRGMRFAAMAWAAVAATGAAQAGEFDCVIEPRQVLE